MAWTSSTPTRPRFHGSSFFLDQVQNPSRRRLPQRQELSESHARPRAPGTRGLQGTTRRSASSVNTAADGSWDAGPGRLPFPGGPSAPPSPVLAAPPPPSPRRPQAGKAQGACCRHTSAFQAPRGPISRFSLLTSFCILFQPPLYSRLRHTRALCPRPRVLLPAADPGSPA